MGEVSLSSDILFILYLCVILKWLQKLLYKLSDCRFPFTEMFFLEVQFRVVVLKYSLFYVMPFTIS